jgi:protein-tyrosine phosphatase
MNSTSRSFAQDERNPASRHLDWDGCFNARDLCDLPTADGRVTRRGAVVRADCLDALSTTGWSALCDHGVRTVIDLRNDDELTAPAAERPAGLSTIHLPLDAIDDSGFWDDWMHGPQFATPLYYSAHLERFPARSARVLAAIAHAQPGGVLVHCFGGRDRTGQIAMLVLALAAVAPDEIAADYALSRRASSGATRHSASRIRVRSSSASWPSAGPTRASSSARRSRRSMSSRRSAAAV